MSIFAPKARLATDVELPTAGTWDIDPAHTLVGFSAVHLGFARVRGEFRSFAGTVVVADNPAESSVAVTIDSASLETREASRDAHLKSEDFLDVEHHRQMTFRSTRVRVNGRRWHVEGDLTIRDVTRPVVLDVEYAGVFTDDDGVPKAVLSARTEFDRRDFGLTWNQVLEAGRLLVGNRVTVELDIQLKPAG